MSDAFGPSRSRSGGDAGSPSGEQGPVAPRGDGGDADLPPLHDPYLTAPAPRAELSTLAVFSVLALLLGPLGAVAAIVFGWAARREIDDAPARRSGHALATVGLSLGMVLTMGWGAALTIGAWTWKYHRRPESVAAPGGIAEAASAPGGAGTAAPSSPPEGQAPGGSVPRTTTLQDVGALRVVDVGVDALSLGEELAKQRAEAHGLGETVLVMTTRDPCDPCRGVDRSLRDPLMQTALRGVRLVRVDIDVFKDDLDQLNMPRHRYPAFFLPAPDLTPRDGIDGGEWDDDIPRNIAPVLGAFVRGQYRVRREPWKPLPGSGVRL